MKHIYLSYTLNPETPFYGNRPGPTIELVSNMQKGDPANNTRIDMSVHTGTHIDLPFHFFKNGQTIDSYSADDWMFYKPLIIEFQPKSLIIEDDLLALLSAVENKENYDILIIKTGLCYKRETLEYMTHNYGFSPLIASYIRDNFEKIRVIGFDSISVSSFQHRDIGRISHREFLNPDSAILIIEDMDLREINEETKCSQLIISPLRIDNCDGLPVTIMAKIDE